MHNFQEGREAHRLTGLSFVEIQELIQKGWTPVDFEEAAKMVRETGYSMQEAIGIIQALDVEPRK